MKVIQGRGTIGDDRVLHIQLPDDAPIGETDVVVVLEAGRGRPSREERSTAFEAGLGAYKNVAPRLGERK